MFIEAAIYKRKNITGCGRVVGSTTRDSAVNMIEYRICKITVLFCYGMGWLITLELRICEKYRFEKYMLFEISSAFI